MMILQSEGNGSRKCDEGQVIGCAIEKSQYTLVLSAGGSDGNECSRNVKFKGKNEICKKFLRKDRRAAMFHLGYFDLALKKAQFHIWHVLRGVTCRFSMPWPLPSSRALLPMIETSQQHWRFVQWMRILGTSTVAVLIYAAGGKLLEMSMEGKWSTAIICLVALEILLVMAISAWPASTRIAAACAIVFGLFALEALRLTIAGRSDCGCFGAVPVAPRYTLALDVGLSLLWGFTFVFVRRLDVQPSAGRSFPASVTPWFAALLLLSLTAVPSSNEAANHFSTWNGRLFADVLGIDPISLPPELNSGRRDLLIVRPECEDCQTALRLIEEAHKLRDNWNPSLVEIHNETIVSDLFGSAIPSAAVADIPTPLFVRINDGLIEYCGQSIASEGVPIVDLRHEALASYRSSSQ